MSKYISRTMPYPSGNKFAHDNPPYSIPGVHLPNIEVYDDLLDADFQKNVYEYLLKQPWYVAWLPLPPELQIYKPDSWDDSWIQSGIHRRAMALSRCLLGSDETSLQQNHPTIWQLWQRINQKLDNRYTLSGVPEGMHWNDVAVPPTSDPGLESGWRVYGNASPHMLVSPGSYAHRDNKNLTDDSSVTIIYMASPEWYPSWGGEIHFYPEDPEGLTGDHQQFNSAHQQRRNYRIGWDDEGKIVCLKPNRLLVYDGRALHGTIPTRNYNNNQLHRRVVFRARLKS